MIVQFTKTAISDVVVVEPRAFGDGRGFFLETWQRRKFAAAQIPVEFVQDNHSRSIRNTLRGLHYQIRQPQGKLVQVVSGAVFDVAVDLRRSSPTFGQWVGQVLSDVNHHQMWIPPGFAHGFLVLSESTDFIYKCTDYYAPQFERTLRWNDPDVGIQWPMSADEQPLLSVKDAAGTAFREAECFA